MPYTVAWAAEDENCLRFPARNAPCSEVEALDRAEIVETWEKAQALKNQVIDADPLRVVNVIGLLRVGNGWLVIHDQSMRTPCVVARWSVPTGEIEFLTEADYSPDAFSDDEYRARRFHDFDRVLRVMEATCPDNPREYRFQLWGSVAPEGRLYTTIPE
jgi:hypothetical protein